MFCRSIVLALRHFQQMVTTTKLRRQKFLRLASGAAMLSALLSIANAQTYPMRPITLVVPFAAGGPTDVVGRIVAERMRSSLGQPIIIENVSGAGGSIGAGRVARAIPDGYTAVVGNSDTHVVNGAVYSLSYDVTTDFEPIALLSSYPMVLVSKNAVPAKDLKELIAWLRSNQATAVQGTVGAGSLPHLCGVDLQNRIGSRWRFVPYRGGAPAMQDLAGGQIDLVCLSPGGTLPLARSGQIRAYAILGKSRLTGSADVPTVDEAGLPGFYVPFWNALWMPKNTPKTIVAKINAAVVEALNDGSVRRRLNELEVEIPPPEQQTPEALAALQRSEIEKWGPIIKAANIRGE
jgi:tripartite-type tricarboxylate transporter receptor subunit TctC